MLFLILTTTSTKAIFGTIFKRFIVGFPKSSNNPKGIFDHKMTGWINKRVFFRASHGQIFFEFIITIFTSSTTGTITEIMKDTSHFSIIYVFQFFTYHSGLKFEGNVIYFFEKIFFTYHLILVNGQSNHTVCQKI